MVEAFGAWQPAPAPRLERTPASVPGPAPRPGQHTAEILEEIGLTSREIDQLAQEGVIDLSASRR
jgi:alpha-methylacyl-CoA racemase